MTRQRSRRRFLGGIGLLALGSVTGLAGCTSQSASPGDGGDTTDAETTTRTATDATTTTASGAGASAGRSVTDAAGRTVTVPADVERVVALGSGGLRFVTYAGGVDRVVGVEQLETSNADRPYRPYTLANQGLTGLPTVGTRKEPDRERVLQTDPDVVVYAYASESAANEMQDKLGVPVVTIRPGGLTPELRSSFFDSLDLLGTVLGTTDRVERLRADVEDVLADLADRRGRVETKSDAYVGYLGRGKHGLTFTQPSYVPFALGGVANVAAGASGSGGGGGSGGGDGSGGGSGGGDGSGGGSGGGDGSGGGGGGGGDGGRKGATRITIDPETLLKWDPEVLFVDLGTESYDALDAPEYQDVTAIANGDVYAVLPTRDYGTNFGTVLADAYAVGAAANPDVYDVDPVAKANELYETFVGEGVYEGVADAYGDGFGRME
ncbi:MAG: ABC transporter substrate-binding protein [Haloferacaceae archaeon]